ncbi:CatB-related O-acetyltransferase [Arthrobacter sp. TB 23]|uniref:CatB-related O-acetyltransferase n=1 Tax=Arthrobacter sp. TB 23 TaxID=494419 RepID=UPI000A038411|nr:CatB-related O-acetyltransferase [Arthrobacter sp. TB 23]
MTTFDLGSIEFARPRVLRSPSHKWLVMAEPNVNVNYCELMGNSFFGFGSYINSGRLRSQVEVGRYCSIGRNVSIGLGSHRLEGFSTSSFLVENVGGSPAKLARGTVNRRVLIGHDVWIGDNVSINSGVTVGTGAVIATGAVVVKDVAPYQIVGGVSAREIRPRFSDDLVSQLLFLEWWNLHPVVLKKLVTRDVQETIDRLHQVDKERYFFERCHETVVPPA